MHAFSLWNTASKFSYLSLNHGSSSTLDLDGRDGKVTFRWNSRLCSGTRFHKAALDGDLATVEAILVEDPEALSSRFTYETFYDGVPQEGSAEAIHIAASRGHEGVVRALLSRGVATNSVSSDPRDQHDVLHAAVFAEGRGGGEGMVRLLLEHKAPLVSNNSSRNPLHLAFQTGQASLIPLLREEMGRRGVLEAAESDALGETPLKVGIHMRKLSEEQLSQAAALTAESLLVFIQEEPGCIPSFLKRFAKHKGVRAKELSKLITVQDLVRLLAENQVAADALLSAVTGTPEMENEGWHPLPTRISFAPRDRGEWIQGWLNPPRDCIERYVPERVWRFNTAIFEEPLWHKDFIGKGCGRPVQDVHIKVCEVPNLACPEFLAALCRAADDDNLSIFKNRTVRSLLQIVWWNGAIWVDGIQFILSVWGLVLLLLETYREKGQRRSRLSVAQDFLSSRAMIDGLHELAQFVGLATIGRMREYFDLGNLYDVFRCVLPALLIMDIWDKGILAVVILIYWARILEVNFSESMSSQLLPITRVARGLLPASIVASVGFCAFTHALSVLDDGGKFESRLALNSFEMLLTAQVPDEIKEDSEENTPVLYLMYLSMMVFTVFFLNIFIGVIGEQYGIQKDSCDLVFQNLRANICSTFLIRATVIPCWLMPRGLAMVATGIAAATCLSLQVLIYTHRLQLERPWITFSICFAVMLLSCYQDPSAPWSRRCHPSQGERAQEVTTNEHFYLWFAESVAMPTSDCDT